MDAGVFLSAEAYYDHDNQLQGAPGAAFTPVSPPSQGRKVEITIKEQEMKKSTKKTTPVFRKKLGWVLPTAVFMVMPLAAPATIAVATAATTMGCDNGTTPTPTPETARNIPIPGHTNIVIYGLPSLVNPYIDDFKNMIDIIYDASSSGEPVDRFKNYVNQIDQLKIIIENVPDYGNGFDFRTNIDRNTFAVRSDFLATKPDLWNVLLPAIEIMNNQYGVVVLNKQFNNAKETIWEHTGARHRF
jgi:hypothetical protein